MKKLTLDLYRKKALLCIKKHYPKEEYETVKNFSMDSFRYYYDKNVDYRELGHWFIDRADF